MNPRTRTMLRGLAAALVIDVATATAAYGVATTLLSLPVSTPLATIAATTGLLYMVRFQRTTYP